MFAMTQSYGSDDSLITAMLALASVLVTHQASECDGTVMRAVGQAGAASLRSNLHGAGGQQAFEEHYAQGTLAHLCS